MKLIHLALLTFLLLACGNEASNSSPNTVDYSHTEDVVKSIETINIGGIEIANENCKLLEYQNGDPIPLVTSLDEWLKHSVAGEGCAAYVNFDPSNMYGVVYNGFVIEDERRIAPNGYHIATKNDWQKIVTAVDGDVAALKSDKLWKVPGNNSTGFNALPTGEYSRMWSGAQEKTRFWTSTIAQDNENYHYCYDLYASFIEEWSEQNGMGFCIRFVKD